MVKNKILCEICGGVIDIVNFEKHETCGEQLLLMELMEGGK